MRCSECPYDLGYKEGMHWPPYEKTCEIDMSPYISRKGFLYNIACTKDKIRQQLSLSLVDGVTEIVELFGHNGTPYQKTWSKKWLKRAKWVLGE
jgi:hypothetical protein